MRDPDLSGDLAQAWRLGYESMDGDPPDWEACVSAWILHAPSAHPFLKWWYISAIHLRDIRGVPPAVKRMPWAEHEVQIAALDPAHTPNPDQPRGTIRFLRPLDLAEQFGGLTDTEAEMLVQGMVREICNGHFSPDSDYRSWWRGWLAERCRIRSGGEQEKPAGKGRTSF